MNSNFPPTVQKPANSAYSYDTDTFSYATADETGSLTAKLATITIIKDGGSLSVQDEAIVTDQAMRQRCL